jgi:hypothetical protein
MSNLVALGMYNHPDDFSEIIAVGRDRFGAPSDSVFHRFTPFSQVYHATHASSQLLDI